MCNKRLTVEQVIQLKKDKEELRQLRNLKYNLELGVVTKISKELVKVLMVKNWRDL